MKTLGIIAEFNPLHDGHSFFLREAKEAAGADYLVVVMSGDFVQRGAPAVCDKFSRAKMALSEGADLVLELPIYYALASAEHFATGAVSVLNALGVVDTLAFGSETGDVIPLQTIADVLLAETEEFQSALKAALKEGLSFPAAREKAFLASAPQLTKDIPALLQQDPDILKGTNNILGIEYLKALTRTGSPMQPLTVKRATQYASAAQIRDTLFGTGSETPAARARRRNLALSLMPYACRAILTEAAGKDGTGLVTTNDFSQILQYKLAVSAMLPSVDVVDLSQDLWERIRWTYSSTPYQSFDEFTASLKSKNLTYTAIQRALLHLLLDINNTSMRRYTGAAADAGSETGADAGVNGRNTSAGYTVYLRALGFKKDASPLLKAIKENAAMPLITKLADAEKQLLDTPQGADALALLKEDIAASRVYDVVRRRTEKTEYEKQVVIL